MAEADLGDDIGGIDDIDANLSEVEGRLGLLHDVARRWYDLAGSLWYDTQYGFGLARLLSAEMPSPSAAAGVLEDEALKDERVEDCSVTVSVVGENLSIAGSISDADGPFTFSVLVDQVSGRVLLENSVLT